MTSLTTAEAQEKLPALLRRVGRGDRFVLRNGDGKMVGALVSPEDLAFIDRRIEEEEDRVDASEVRKIRARIRAGTEKTIPWEQVKSELGIE